MMLLALVLGALCWTGVVRLWHVLVLAFLLGAAMAIDTPARQSFVVELVGKEDLSNAIALNASIFHGARVIGPAAAGILVAVSGVAGAFFLNGASFLAVLLALFLMDVSLIRRTGGVEAARDPLAGVRYLRENRVPRAVVLLISLSAMIAMPFYVLVPIITKEILGGGAGSYGVLMSSAGVGSVVGSLFAANPYVGKHKGSMLVTSSLVFPVLLLVLAFMKGYAGTLLVLVLVGFSYVVQNASANSLLQENVPDHLRGRVMSLYVSMLLGMMRIGALLLGTTAELTSTPTALAAFAVAGIAASLWIRQRYPELQAST
jgi:MFS family permease